MELLAALRDNIAAERALAAERLAMIAELKARNVPADHGYTSVTSWLRATLRTTINRAAETGKLAQRLPQLPALGKALADADVSDAQAAVIAEAVAEFAGSVQTEAAQALIEQAAILTPEELRVAGRRILHHVDPDAAEEHDRKAMEREAKRANATRGFTLTPDSHGGMRISGHTDAEGAAIITSALDPLCNPARGTLHDIAASETGYEPLPLPLQDTRTAAQGRHDALIDIFRRTLAAGELPENGGDKAQLVVTVSYDPLSQAVSAATLDTGARLSPDSVRRIACDCGVIPAVLNSFGVPLDLGRERRLISGALRRALVLRDKGCAFPACDRPPRWCQGHHVIHWLDGGPTCLDNSVLVCGHHHRLIHQGDWAVAMATDGLPEFIPPAHLDPSQTPRRNTFHRGT